METDDFFNTNWQHVESELDRVLEELAQDTDADSRESETEILSPDRKESSGSSSAGERLAGQEDEPAPGQDSVVAEARRQSLSATLAGLKSWTEKHERWRERQREWEIEVREARQERKAEERQAKEAVRAGNKKAYDRAYSAKRRADEKAAREAARKLATDEEEAAAFEAALVGLDLDPVKSIAEIERAVAAQAQIRLRLLTEAVKAPPPHLSHRLRQLKGGEQNIVDWWAVRERLVQNGEHISYGICASCRSQLSTTGEEFSRARAQNAYKTIVILEELGVWPRAEDPQKDPE